MYIPHLNRMEPEEEIVRFIQSNSFAILVSNHEGVPCATHLPLLYAPGGDGRPATLRGHFARANPQWQDIDGAEVLAIFSGPHGYISSSWYEEKRQVSTWNYLAVHVYGRCRILADFEDTMEHLVDIVRYYEPNSHILPWLKDDDFRALGSEVVTVEIAISRMEGKAKLSQNKPRRTVESVIEHLERRGGAMDGALADEMRKSLARRGEDGRAG